MPRTQDYEYDMESATDDVRTRLEDLAQEMRDWYDNMPENFQNGSKGETISQTADTLEDALGYLSDCPASASLLPRFKVPLMTKRQQSRAERCSEAVAILDAAIDHINAQMTPTSTLTEEIRSELQDFASELESAKDCAEQAEFPGMYG